MRIVEICTRDAVHIGPDASVADAAELMRTRHVGALVVVEQPNGERYPVGIITDRDIVLTVVSKRIDPERITVADVMSRDLVSCGEHDELFGAIQAMRLHGVRRMPVLDGKGALRGMLSADDAMAAIGQHLTDLAAALRREQAAEMRTRT